MSKEGRKKRRKELLQSRHVLGTEDAKTNSMANELQRYCLVIYSGFPLLLSNLALI